MQYLLICISYLRVSDILKFTVIKDLYNNELQQIINDQKLVNRFGLGSFVAVLRSNVQNSDYLRFFNFVD